MDGDFQQKKRSATNQSRIRARYELQDRPDVTRGHERASQRPFGTVQSVNRLLNEGKLEDAIQMVVSAPISSQNEVVWTVLIKQALKAQRANLAFQLYNQVCALNSRMK